MAVSKKRKGAKKYQPKRIDTTGLRAITNQKPFDKKNTEDYCMDFGWISLTKMMQEPNDRDFIRMLQITNEVVFLLNIGIGENDPAVDRTLDGVQKVINRHKATGSWVLDGIQIQDLRRVLAIWEEQCKQCPSGLLTKTRNVLDVWEKSKGKANPQKKTAKIVKKKNGDFELQAA